MSNFEYRTALLLATLVALGCRTAQAQIAPGPLSRAHADLNGVTRCASCHDFGARRLKCLECHTEIERRLAARTGFHPREYKSSPGATDCARCHAEHRGPGFQFVPLDRKAFDHGARTGFVLEGRHREQACAKCHNAARITTAARSEIKVKDLDRTFLGLRRECTFCHQEPHRNQLGADCLACHSPHAWKPASRFDHSRAKFRLSGQHLKVVCGKCHARAASAGSGEAPGQNGGADAGSGPKEILFKGLTYSNCRNCHEDRHHGGFQDAGIDGKCESCHTPDGWKTNRPETRVNHNLTKFRLVGKHAELDCGKCHKEYNFAAPVRHDSCRDCHQDRHNGQFAARAAGADCSSCHSPTGFKPALFDRAAHGNGPFQLTGKHSTLSCAKCHPAESSGIRFKTGKLSCSECHADQHNGQFASEPYNNRCDMCHTPAGFKATTFSAERHGQTQFPLTGRHTTVACDKCHKAVGPADSSTQVDRMIPVAFSPSGSTKAVPGALRRFRFPSHGCDACHDDPHAFSPQSKQSCMSCHVTRGWKDRLSFDHSITGFKLDGKHADAERPVPCAGCHKNSGQAAGEAKAVPIFAKSTAECARCHEANDAHDGQFLRPGEGRRDCSSCHVTAGWKAGGFNHELTGFALNSAHRNRECAKCHKAIREVNGRVIRAYRNTPRDCLKCH